MTLISPDSDDVAKNWHRVLLWRDGEKSESVLGEILIRVPSSSSVDSPPDRCRLSGEECCDGSMGGR